VGGSPFSLAAEAAENAERKGKNRFTTESTENTERKGLRQEKRRGEK
jgi:hypothetical protein